MVQPESERRTVPARIASRAAAIAWPIPVYGAVEAVAAPNAVVAVCRAALDLSMTYLVMLFVPGRFPQYDRIVWLGVGVNEVTVVRSPSGFQLYGARQSVEILRAPLATFKFKRVGAVCGRVDLADRRFFIPRLQWRELARLIDATNGRP